jgi:hypothetical protein
MKATSLNSFPMLAVAAAAASAALTLGTAGLAAVPSFGHAGGGAHMGMPSGAFHGGAPRSFHGPSERVGAPFSAPHLAPSDGGRDLGHFRGRSVDHFSPADRARWSEGGWRHGWRHGHLGWWWVVDGLWYFYDQPSYPYPDYVGSDQDYGDSSDDPWSYDSYYCEDPPGYYPAVQACNVEWEPATPK